MSEYNVQDLENLIHWVCDRSIPYQALSAEEREDAVQDTFVALLEAQARRDPDKNFRTLVNIRIRGALMDFWRKRSILRHRSRVLEPAMTKDTTHRTMESRITRKTLTMQVKAMMYGLQEKQRRAVECYYLQGKTVQETADILGVADTTAWRLIKRGVTELRESMEEYHPYGVNWKP